MKANIGSHLKTNFIVRFIFCLILLAAVVLVKVPAVQAEGIPYNVITEEVFSIQGNVDAVAIGKGVVQGWQTNSSSNLQVTLPPGSTIEKVFLYFGGLELDGLPLNQATATVNGTSLGTNDPIGSGGGYLTNYRWDVTTVVQNGSNEITIQTNGSEEHFSHILLIIYSNPALPTQRVIVNDGLYFFYGEPGYSEATTNFYNITTGSGKLINAVFAGDIGGVQESISFNGAYSACCSIWDGSTGPAFDIDTLTVTTVNGTNTEKVTTGDDAIAWQFAALVAGPAVPVPTLTPGNLLIPNAGLNVLQEFDPISRTVVQSIPVPPPYYLANPSQLNLLTALVRESDHVIFVNVRDMTNAPFLLALAENHQILGVKRTGSGWLQQIAFDPSDPTGNTILGGIPMYPNVAAINPFAGTIANKITFSNGNFIGLVTDKNGNILAGDLQSGLVLIYDQNGSNQGTYVNVRSTTGSNEINGMTLDKDGYLYIAQNSYNRIAKYSSSRTFLGFINNSNFNRPVSVFYNPSDDYIYAGNINDDKLIILTTTGTQVSVLNMGGNFYLGIPALIRSPVAPPMVDAGGPYTVEEGSPVVVAATGSDPQNGTLTYAWDLDNNGTFETTGQNVSFNASDGPDTQTIAVRATNPGGLSATAQTTVTVLNVAPTATFVSPISVNEGFSFTISLTDPYDPSSADVTAGFAYAFDCGDGSGYGSFGPANTTSCSTTDNSIRLVKGKIKDEDGGVNDFSASVSVLIVAPTADFTASPSSLNEGQYSTLTFSNPSDPSSNDTSAGFKYSYDCANDGVFEVTNITVASYPCVYPDNGSFTALGWIMDKDGGTTSYTANVIVDNIAPSVGLITAPLVPVQINTLISTFASFTDPGILDSHTGVWDWDDGSTSAGIISEANGSGTVSGSHTYSLPGVYTVVLTITDNDGGKGTSTYEYVVAYDPNGSFVTGGGWINSPVGAYPADPSLTGKATFGFIAKYKKGATFPTGNTEFQFNIANLNFHSENYEWLVVAGARAQFKGLGTINGTGSFKFILTAIDGQVSGGGGADKFRIKIWSVEADGTETVVYDNQIGATLDANPTTAIQGGSIIIHK